MPLYSFPFYPAWCYWNITCSFLFIVTLIHSNAKAFWISITCLLNRSDLLGLTRENCNIARIKQQGKPVLPSQAFNDHLYPQKAVHFLGTQIRMGHPIWPILDPLIRENVLLRGNAPRSHRLNVTIAISTLSCYNMNGFLYTTFCERG